EGHRDVRTGLGHGFGHGAVHRQGEVIAVAVHVGHGGAGLSGVHAADDVGSGLQHQGGVLGAHAAGDALDDDLRIGVQVDRHSSLQSLFRSSRGGSGAGQFGRAVGAAVHGVGEGDQRVVPLVQDGPSVLDVVAVEPHHELLRGGVTEQVESPDDALGDLVASGDATEDVHEHALDLVVTEDDVQTGGHHLGVGAAADVQEVGGLDAAVLLPGVGDHVQGGHDQSGT